MITVAEIREVVIATEPSHYFVIAFRHKPGGTAGESQNYVGSDLFVGSSDNVGCRPVKWHAKWRARKLDAPLLQHGFPGRIGLQHRLHSKAGARERRGQRSKERLRSADRRSREDRDNSESHPQQDYDARGR